MNKKREKEELSLDHYKMVTEYSPICTIDIVFINPERTETLLGKRNNEPVANIFYTFGGRLYKNEDFLNAACRIAKQETGLSLSPSGLVFAGVLNEIHENSKFPGINYHAVDIYFGYIIKKQTIVLDAQHSEARWIDVNDQTLHPNVSARVAEALRAL